MTDLELRVENASEFAHGAMFALHSFSSVYHMFNKNYKHAAIHAVVAGYDLYSVFVHKNYKKEILCGEYE